MSAQSIDGLVIWSAGLPLFVDRLEMNAFCQRFRPLPMVTAGVPIEGIPGVSVDNYRGMRAVVSHLIEVHRRTRIAFIRGPEYHQEAEERYRAYMDVLSDYDIPFDPGLVVQSNFKESGGAAAAEQLMLSRRDGFDALVAASDNMAIGALRVLQAHGLRVPGDVALAGLNDESQSPFVTPPLTTGPLHFYEQARRATEMLLALLAGASCHRPGDPAHPTADPAVVRLSRSAGDAGCGRTWGRRAPDRSARPWWPGANLSSRRCCWRPRPRRPSPRRAWPRSSWTASPPRSPATRRAHFSKPWATVCAAAWPQMSRFHGGRARCPRCAAS